MNSAKQRRIRLNVRNLVKGLTPQTTIPTMSKIVWNLLLPQIGNKQVFLSPHCEFKLTY